ncbi:hypothetical protein AB0M22_44975 [Nocardia sp. NPDC051756]|uniref:hypothetical protein n=1 Tax=Nocardia sp. NPDC051756 TaxID=3154751 RepID=UPI00342F3A36
MILYRCPNPDCYQVWHYVPMCPNDPVRPSPEAARRIIELQRSGAFDTGPWYPRFKIRPPLPRGERGDPPGQLRPLLVFALLMAGIVLALYLLV